MRLPPFGCRFGLFSPITHHVPRNTGFRLWAGFTGPPPSSFDQFGLGTVAPRSFNAPYRAWSYCRTGIDLHGNNLVIDVINRDGKRMLHLKLDCPLEQALEFPKPIEGRRQSLAVESTFNWHWLVDWLQARGYRIDLANPVQIE